MVHDYAEAAKQMSDSNDLLPWSSCGQHKPEIMKKNLLVNINSF